MSLGVSSQSTPSLPSAYAGQTVNVYGVLYVWDPVDLAYKLPVARPGSGYKRFIATGDSITAEATLGGWPVYFSVLSNGEYICTYNDAVAGTTLTQMAARFAAIPSWVKADIVMIQGGTNNPGVNQANKDAIYSLVAQSYARGAIPQIHACPPLLNSTAIADWNLWLALYCAKKGIEYVDKWSGIVDPATGAIDAAYQRDATHPNPAGQVAGAQRLLDIMRAKNGASTQWVYPLQFSNIDTGKIGIVSNPLNTTDTNADGNGDGWGAPSFVGPQTPTPCTSTATRATAVLPAIGRPQRYQDAFLYASQGSQHVRHPKNLLGQSARANHRIHVVSHFRLNDLTQVQANSVIVEATFATNGSTNYNAFNHRFNAVGLSGIHVREFVLPASMSDIYLTWRSYGGDGTTDFEVGNVQIYDLTEQGLD